MKIKPTVIGLLVLFAIVLSSFFTVPENAVPLSGEAAPYTYRTRYSYAATTWESEYREPFLTVEQIRKMAAEGIRGDLEKRGIAAPDDLEQRIVITKILT